MRHRFQLFVDPRDLEQGQVLLEVPLQFLAWDGQIILDGIIAAADLATRLIGHTDDGGLLDVGIFIEELFDFPRVNVFAHGNNHFLQAVDDMQVAVFVANSDIAGVEPASFESLGRFLRLVPIALHDVFPLDEELALLADGDIMILFVNDAHLGTQSTLSSEAIWRAS